MNRRQFAAAACALPLVAATKAQASSYSVTIQGMAYTPAEFNVVAGDTIIFINNDSMPHTATAEDGSFDTGQINPGQSVEVTIPAGSHPYYCLYHPGMRGVANAS
jgi:plastocyanin